MAQQKSEDRVVLEGGVTPVEPAGSSPERQGKAVPVEETAVQLCLAIATAEVPQGSPRAMGVPKAVANAQVDPSVTMEQVASRLTSAMLKVVSNKGAQGPDGMTVETLRERWPVVVARLHRQLLEGSWRPGEVRRALIPKAGGGQRGLGIPNVVDRVVMEAVRQVLEPVFEPTFHSSSHGFRPGRSCHTAIDEAKRHLEDGYEWVVDLDLEKFFDRVCHQRLLSRLAQRVGDRRVLVLIGRMLKAKVVLPDGVVITTEEGVPQGSPLSPLLSNVVLDEFDRELARRGHRFVRYADDCNVYVGSERAGQRVMEGLTRFIQWRLRLRVNADKSAVARPENRHLLGFRLCRDAETGAVEVMLSERTKRNAMERIRQLTPRQWGGSLDSCIREINAWLRGWHQFFAIVSSKEQFTLRALDAHIRRRLRAIALRHWKRRRTIVHNLIALGVKRSSAYGSVHGGHKGLWALSHTYAVDHAMPVRFFTERGLERLVEMHRRTHEHIVAPVKRQLALQWE
jgi:RNA-directed DNA polymerase